MQRHGWAFFAAEMLVVGALSAANKLPADLTIALQFDRSVSASALQEMKNEFERIMHPAVLNIEWRMRSDVAGNEVFHEIILMSGDGKRDGARRQHSAHPRLYLLAAFQSTSPPQGSTTVASSLASAGTTAVTGATFIGKPTANTVCPGFEST